MPAPGVKLKLVVFQRQFRCHLLHERAKLFDLGWRSQVLSPDVLGCQHQAANGAV